VADPVDQEKIYGTGTVSAPVTGRTCRVGCHSISYYGRDCRHNGAQYEQSPSSTHNQLRHCSPSSTLSS